MLFLKENWFPFILCQIQICMHCYFLSYFTYFFCFYKISSDSSTYHTRVFQNHIHYNPNQRRLFDLWLDNSDVLPNHNKLQLNRSAVPLPAFLEYFLLIKCSPDSIKPSFVSCYRATSCFSSRCSTTEPSKTSCFLSPTSLTSTVTQFLPSNSPLRISSDKGSSIFDSIARRSGLAP